MHFFGIIDSQSAIFASGRAGSNLVQDLPQIDFQIRHTEQTKTNRERANKRSIARFIDSCEKDHLFASLENLA